MANWPGAGTLTAFLGMCGAAAAQEPNPLDVTHRHLRAQPPVRLGVRLLLKGSSLLRKSRGARA
jgi:hypothetical protein